MLEDVFHEDHSLSKTEEKHSKRDSWTIIESFGSWERSENPSCIMRTLLNLDKEEPDDLRIFVIGVLIINTRWQQWATVASRLRSETTFPTGHISMLHTLGKRCTRTIQEILRVLKVKQLTILIITDRWR